MAGLHFKSGIDNGFNADIDKMNAKLNSFGKDVNTTGTGISNTFKNIALAAGGMFAISQARSFVTKIIEVRGEMQQLDVAFTTMLGSKTAANKLLAQSIELAAKTPFELSDITKATKQMLAYGFATDSMTDNLSMLGNIASGVSAPIGDIVYLYGTLRTQGRAYAQDIKQFAGRGIPIYEELAKVMGINQDEVMNFVSAGKVGFEEVEKAFQNMTGAGGMFNNLMEEQSKTITGRISNLSDALYQMFNVIGEESEGVINTALDSASFLIDNYEQIGSLILELIGVYGAYKVAVMLFAAAQQYNILVNKEAVNQMVISRMAGKAMTTQQSVSAASSIVMANATKRLTTSIKLMGKSILANPIGLIATGIALALPLIQKFATSNELSREKLDENIKSMLEYNKAQQVSEKSIKSLTDEYISLAKSTDESKEKTDKLKKIEDELQKQRPDIILSTDTFATKLDKIKKAGNEASINIDKLSKAEKGLYESTKLLNKQAATKSLNEAKDAINKSYTVLFAAKEVNLTTEKGREEIIKQTEIESKKLLASQNELDNFKLELGKKKGNGLSITSADKDYLSMLKDEVNKHDEILNQYSEMVTLINNLQIAQKNLDDANAIPKEKTPEEIELERLQLIQDEKDKANASKLLADKKQEEIDKKNNEKALKALELSNQNTINEIKLNAVKTLKTDDELKKQLLENDLVYLDKKKKLTADNLEKSKITEQIIDTKVTISTSSSETAKQLQDKLDEYKTYLEKRSDIAKKYDEDIKKELDNGYKDRANVAEKEKQSALKAFDESTILQNEQYKEWLNNTLPQIIEDGGEKVKDALQNTRDVLSEKLINEKDSEQILIYQAMIDKLDESIKNLGKKGAEDNNDFKDKIELLNEIRTLTDSFADSLSNGSDNLSVLFKGIGNTIGGIVEMSNAFKLVEEGMGAIEKATVTLAVISAAIKVVNAIINVSAQIQQNKIDANVLEIETQTALNLSLLERNKIKESYFSSQDWGKALNGLDNYNKSLNLQKEALLSIQKNNEKQANTKTDNGIAQTMALSNVNSSKSDLENALSGITYKTKDKGKLSNFIGIADTYDSLLNVYPDLIDAEGNLNKELAQTVVNSGKISEVSKAGLEQLLTYTDEAEKSYAEFGNFISSIFGGVGDSITESFRDAYTNGTDAMEGLGDSMSKMIENFTDKTIQFAFLQPIFDELNNATESLGKDYASGGISSTELQKGIVDELGKFYSDVDGMSTTISDAYKLADELASNDGFDSAFNASSTDTQTSTAKSGAITQSITEDTGSMIVGRMGAMMLSNERIANYSENALDLAVSNLVMLGKIKDDTSFLPEIAENTRKTYQKLENI